MAKNRRVRVTMHPYKSVRAIPEQGYVFNVNDPRELVVTAEDAAVLVKRARKVGNGPERMGKDMNGKTVPVGHFHLVLLDETDEAAEAKIPHFGSAKTELRKSEGALLREAVAMMAESQKATAEAFRSFTGKLLVK